MSAVLSVRPAILASIAAALAVLSACAREDAAEMPIEVTEAAREAATEPAGQAVYRTGIFAEPISRNYWSFYGGPAGSVWTQYVLDGYATTLYGYSDRRFDWVPVIAADFPTDLKKETVDGSEFWTTEVPIKEGVQWSDGEELTAEDVAFTVRTALDLGLGANWARAVDTAFLERVDALDSHQLKVFFKTIDEDGNPQTPGLSVWQFGLGFMPILPERYWAPIVEEAKRAGEPQQQIESLFAHVPDGEPTSNGFTFSRWEAGAFFENEAASNFFRKGAVITQYENGALVETNERLGQVSTFYGEAGGGKSLEYEVGPHASSEIFSIYGNQDAAILALTNGDVDYVFNPLGMERGFQDRVRAAGDLEIVTNPDNSVFYMGFNVRKPPMNVREFRQAVAAVIDKEFVTQSILQGSALPMYAMVPEGNAYWHNPDIDKIGQGLSRGERVERAVDLLKSAGFTYDQEPQIGEDGNVVSSQGQGLKMPDGSDVPGIELIAPSAGYDPLRATFAIWIERWLNDIGIPVRANLAGFNVIVDKLFSDSVAEDLDMWILGWSLTIFPDYMESYFHSRNAPENQDGGENWGGYANQEFDDLAFGLLSETTIEGARDTVFRLQEFLAEDLPYVPLFTIPKLDSYRPSRIEFPYTDVLGGLEGLNGMQQAVLIK